MAAVVTAAAAAVVDDIDVVDDFFAAADFCIVYDREHKGHDDHTGEYDGSDTQENPETCLAQSRPIFFSFQENFTPGVSIRTFSEGHIRLFFIHGRWLARVRVLSSFGVVLYLVSAHITTIFYYRRCHKRAVTQGPLIIRHHFMRVI